MVKGQKLLSTAKNRKLGRAMITIKIEYSTQHVCENWLQNKEGSYRVKSYLLEQKLISWGEIWLPKSLRKTAHNKKYFIINPYVPLFCNSQQACLTYIMTAMCCVLAGCSSHGLVSDLTKLHQKQKKDVKGKNVCYFFMRTKKMASACNLMQRKEQR